MWHIGSLALLDCHTPRTLELFLLLSHLGQVAGAAGLPHSTNPLRVAEARDPGAFGPVSGPLSVVAV